MLDSTHRRIARRQANPPPSDSSPPTPPSTTAPSPTTAPSTTPSQSPTSTTTGTSSTSDSGLLGGLFGPSTTTSPSSAISTSPSSSAHTTDSHTFHAQSVTSLGATVTSSNPLSTYSVTITSSSATATQANANANNDSGPIAGGVIGGLFAVAGLGMLVSFLLRRWRRRQIDKAVFGKTDFRKSAMALDDDASTETLTKQQHNNPRPPTMIERRVAGTPAPAQQRMHAGGVPPPQAYGGYGQPFYPPQSMQRGYYPQQPDRPYTPHLQPAAYNQMYNAGGGAYSPQVVPPARTQTPLHQPAEYGGPPPRTQTPLYQPQQLQNNFPNPYGAPSVSPMPATAGDAESAGDGPPTME